MRQQGVGPAIRRSLASWSLVVLALVWLHVPCVVQAEELSGSLESVAIADGLARAEDSSGNPSTGDGDSTRNGSEDADNTSESDSAAGEDAKSDGSAAGDAMDSDAADNQESSDADETTDDTTKRDNDADASSGRAGTNDGTTVVVQVCFAGLGSEWARVADVVLGEGASAWDASEVALERSGMPYETGAIGTDDVLVSLARSYMDEALSSDLSSGSGWHLFINGERYYGSASTYVLEDGDEVAWRFEAGTVQVSVSVVGPGGTGQAYWIAPTTVEVASTQSAWDASRMVFEQNGYGNGRLLSYSVTEDGLVEFDALASLGSNGVTGESWQVYVNGTLTYENVAQVALHAGDSICWYYASAGTTTLPSFVEKTGAASQNPQTMVHLEGVVAQAWSQDLADDVALAEVLDTAMGLTVCVQEGASSLSAVPALPDPLMLTEPVQRSQGGLSGLLDDKLSCGVGGRAAFGADGALYYLDNSGSLVRLELR